MSLPSRRPNLRMPKFPWTVVLESAAEEASATSTTAAGTLPGSLCRTLLRRPQGEIEISRAR